jgi:Recombinase
MDSPLTKDPSVAPFTVDTRPLVRSGHRYRISSGTARRARGKGLGCYGYRNEKVYDHMKKGEHGEPGIKGMQVIDPEEAEVVLRIFNSYAAGLSYMDIVRMLNSEAVSPPQSTRTNIKPSWSKHAIQCILLSNDRYRGKLTYGRTVEVPHPETGKRERRERPASEWRPERIPSCGLFVRNCL